MVAIPAALSALLIGLLNGFLISRLKLEPMITTLAALVMWRGSLRLSGTVSCSLAHPTFEALGRAIPVHPDSGCGVIAGALLLYPLYALGVISLQAARGRPHGYPCGV